FFLSSRRRHTRSTRDWSSDVCSSDLMLVIHPDECIDCGVCEPECPVEAIKPDTEPGLEEFLKLNAEYAKTWPNITIKRDAPADRSEERRVGKGCGSGGRRRSEMTERM